MRSVAMVQGDGEDILCPGGQFFCGLRQPATPDPTAQPDVVRPSSALVEPLSERELEVLRLIAEGCTNPEIAQRLFLALNTVKVHTRNIYGKLGVHRRTQAVARARELDLL